MVRIIDGDELFQKISGGVRYDQLSSDLYVFAKKQYQQYQKSTNVIGFEITSVISKKNNDIEFSGKFGAINNTIRIKVVLLSNSRIKTSIVDTKTNKNINAQLPSNSKRNSLIAKLPYKTKDYIIEYDQSDDSFVINIFDGGEADLNKATNYLISMLGQDEFNKEKYNFVRSGGFSNDTPLVNIPQSEARE